MPEKLRFRCPCCGMVADVSNLETSEPYQLEAFLEKYGGKRRLTKEDRQARKGLRLGSGSAPGIIEYQDIDVTDELKGLLGERIAELSKLYQPRKLKERLYQ